MAAKLKEPWEPRELERDLANADGKSSGLRGHTVGLTEDSELVALPSGLHGLGDLTSSTTSRFNMKKTCRDYPANSLLKIMPQHTLGCIHEGEGVGGPF